MDSFRMWRVSCNWCFSMNLNLPTYHSPNIEDPPQTMFFLLGDLHIFWTMGWVCD
jgi:hypothetical protein